MKAVVVGAGGTIGQPVVRALSARHEVVRVGHTRGDYQVDISSRDSIERLYEPIGDFDALVCATGKAAFAGLEDLSDAEFELSVSNKLRSPGVSPRKRLWPGDRQTRSSPTRRSWARPASAASGWEMVRMSP